LRVREKVKAAKVAATAGRRAHHAPMALIPLAQMDPFQLGDQVQMDRYQKEASGRMEVRSQMDRVKTEALGQLMAGQTKNGPTRVPQHAQAEVRLFARTAALHSLQAGSCSDEATAEAKMERRTTTAMTDSIPR
jgi:hypothetical protein